jgi:tetratricopeptide (TPR) repeat protein
MKSKNIFILILICFSLVCCKLSNEDLINKGVRFHNKGNYKKAIELYTKVIKRKHKLQLAYYNRGLSYIETKEYSRSLNDFNTILELKTPGTGQFIWNANPDSPFADEEARTQVDYYDALYQRAEVKFFMDSLLSSYRDFELLVNNEYKWAVFCILYQADIWHYSGDEEKACEYAHRARKFAITENEIKKVDDAQRSYCLKSNTP